LLVCIIALTMLSGCPSPLTTQSTTTVFDPPEGTYHSAQTVAITTSTAGASINYTTDGTTPTSTTGIPYSGPVSVGVSQTIQAVAFATGWSDSVATARYTITNTVRSPVFSLPAGVYLTPQSLLLSTITPGTSIRYTTDGTTPTSKIGTLYTGSIGVLGLNRTIKAVAFGAYRSDSAVTAATYTIAVVSTLAGGLNSPEGMVTDGTNLYVADSSDHAIYHVAIATGVVTPFAGTVGSSGSLDGTGTAAQFNGPRGIATDGTNLYVTDYSNSTIRKIVLSTAAVTTIAGSVGSPGSADGTGSVAHFNQPYGIVSAGGNLYVAERANNTIRRIVIATGVVTTLAGTAGSSGTADGTGSAARFNQPEGVATDGTSLYVADLQNHTIRRIVIATAAVTTLAGTPGAPGSTDGVGSAAQFNQPRGVTTDGTYLDVADTTNNMIRRILISTRAVATLAGSLGGGAADGIGSSALFSQPRGIVTDGKSLFVADSGNSTIRMIQ
jgi:sugar lactone lactonase YvrE